MQLNKILRPMNQRRFRFAAVALATFMAAARSATAVEFDAAKLAEVRSAMQQFVDKQQIAGAVTVVGTDQGIVSLEAVGSLNLEAKQVMPKGALFKIASMTKPITAIAIMILVDEGKLSVDDLVSKHLPEFKGQMIVANKDGDTLTLKKPSRPITVRDLLTHTSGLPGGFPEGLGDLYGQRHRTLAEAVLVSSQQPLQFEPGSKWAYCNAGIDTLGRIVEVIAGEPFETFLAKRVFQPLGMKDTAFYPDDEPLHRLAALYGTKDGQLVAAGHVLLGETKNSKHPIPAGGLYSTGADLAKLYQLMLNGGQIGGKRILTAASVATMTKLQTGDLPCGFVPGMGFGFGWAVVREPQGVTSMLSPGSYGHGGAFGTQGWLDPQKKVFVILLIQRVGLANGDASEMRRDLQTIAFGAIK